MKYFDFGIRVEMGEKVGSGHFFRCLSLAEELKKRRKTVIFLISNKEKFHSHGRKKFPYLILKGQTENKKIQKCKELMSKIKLLIIDLPKNEEEYGKKLENYNIAMINDIGKIKIYTKILINGSIVKKFQKYKIKNKATKFLVGPKYMIIRKEFAKEREKTKILKKPVKNILLTFGGSDEKNITSKILSFLLKTDFQITVVLGPTNNNKQKIHKIIKNKSNVKLIINPKKVAPLFSKQDLIISSTGITIYELACLGIPTIMIPINSAQNESAKEMNKRGFGKILDLKKLNLKRLEQTYSKFDNLDYRKKMFRLGKKIIDGKGVERITDILEKAV